MIQNSSARYTGPIDPRVRPSCLMGCLSPYFDPIASRCFLAHLRLNVLLRIHERLFETYDVPVGNYASIVGAQRVAARLTHRCSFSVIIAEACMSHTRMRTPMLLRCLTLHSAPVVLFVPEISLSSSHSYTVLFIYDGSTWRDVRVLEAAVRELRGVTSLTAAADLDIGDFALKSVTQSRLVMARRTRATMAMQSVVRRRFGCPRRFVVVAGTVRLQAFRGSVARRQCSQQAAHTPWHKPQVSPSWNGWRC